jgi:uncharacterized membrane protein YedE/YeeE
LEPLSALRARLRSGSKPPYLQLHAQNQVTPILSRKKSLLGYHLFNPANNKIDKKLVIGAFCFGLGWGIGGLCPGPAIMQFSVFTLQIQAVWLGCMVIGMHLAKRLEMYLGPHEKKQHHHPAIETSMVENSAREVDDKI